MSLASKLSASLPLRLGRGLWRTLAWLLFAAWSLLLLAWLTLHWGILPHLDEWRPRIEALASRELGAPVRIGRIEAPSGGWVPALHLSDVAVLDATGQPALKLPRVAAALSVPGLLALQLRFEQLLFEGLELDVRRDSAGRLHIAGLALGQGQGAEARNPLADWLFEQHEVVVRGATLRWHDELRQAPPLALGDLLLVLRNGLKRHDLRLDATPPPGWGERFSLRARMRAPLLAPASDWRQWSGTAHAHLPLAEVADLRRHVDLPFQLADGRAALRVWLEVKDGQPTGGSADVALRDVALRLGAQLAPLAFEQVAGRLDADFAGGTWRLAARDFGFATADGRVAPPGQLALSLRRQGQGPVPGEVQGGEFSADRLDLAILAGLGERLPIGQQARTLLAGMAPQGAIQGLALRWSGPLDAPSQYQAQARLAGVSIAAAPSPEPGGIGRPGVRRADIELNASDTGGQARLVVAGGAVEFPGVFEQPLVPLTRLDAQLQWHLGAPAAGVRPVSLTVKEARFENDDLRGEVQASWRTGSGTGLARGGRLPGVLDMAGKLTQGRATAVARYLPLGLPREARHYVQHAVQGGQVDAATFKVKGDLWDFPFYNRRDSEFNITGQARNVTLAYVPSLPADPARKEPAFSSPWPAFTQVAGELVFDRSSMAIRNASARLWNVELRDVNGGIADLSQSTLRLEGTGRGPAAELLRFVNTTPVGGWTHQALAQAAGSGSGELKLALALPLAALDKSTVKGSVTLPGNGDLRIQPGTPLLAGVRGRVDFSQQGFAVAGGAARAFGGEASFDGGSQPDGSVRFTAQGTASAEGLRRAAELGPVTRLAQALQGQAPYRLQLGWVKGRQELTLTSPLTGMAVDLPAPLGKAAEAPLALRVQTSAAPEAAGAARDLLRVELGPLLRAQYLRDLSRAEPQVLRGAVGVLAELPALAPGTPAVARLERLDVDQWRATLARLFPAGGGAGAAAVPLDEGYLPQSLALHAADITLGQRRLQRLVLGLNRVRGEGGETLWRANVESDQGAGYVEYRESRSGSGAGRVYARLARLALPPSEADRMAELLDQAPAAVPALDVVVDEFELRGKKLGRLELEAVNRGVAAGAGAGPREWRLQRLLLATPEARLSASGSWAAPPGGGARRMALDFKLELADSGAWLQRLGFGRVVRGGKGRLTGQVGWGGSPLAFDTTSLDGQMNLALEAGQFLKADPGAAKLLGVLSLQSLPRRLLLDFRDVFQEGFSFDAVSGDMQVDRGVVATNNLRLRGVQAVVLMEGSADLNRETQDLRVVVVPEINAGTASLAYAAINPAVGLGTFLAQWLLRRPLQEAGTREFQVSGGWNEPKVERVQRRPGEPAPDASTPAAAASQPANLQ